jgi:hypothetical protein
MADYTVNFAKHATLVGSAVDTITLTGSASFILVTNRSLSGTPIYFTVGDEKAPPPQPVSAGNDTFNVGPGATIQIPGTGVATIVKLISSDAQPYSVVAT